MNATLAKALIVGVPLLFSLAWCLYWVLKLLRFQKKRKHPESLPAAPPGGDARP
jgi:hypothetical protein